MKREHKLLDAVIQMCQLKSDADLCRLLDVSPSYVSKVRAGKVNIGAEMILAIHEETELAIKDIKRLIHEQG